MKEVLPMSARSLYIDGGGALLRPIADRGLAPYAVAGRDKGRPVP